MAIAVGNIVTVISNETAYFEKQGEVVEIVQNDGDSDGPIGIKFGKECRHLFMWFHDGDTTPVRFFETELRVDADWSLETKIYRAYGSRLRPHSIARLKEAFNPKSACGTKHCDRFADRRCIINVWGTVYEIDLCAECAPKYDGKLGEAFPQKQLVRVA